MIWRGVSLGTFSALLLCSQPVLGCEMDPFLFQLPGETEAAAHERSEKVFADHEVVRHHNRERFDFENAAQIYLARVVSRMPSSYGKERITLPSVVVRPMTSLKGSLPSIDRELTGEGAGGMCTDVGDGYAPFSQVGDLVVVFEGVPKSQLQPRGIDSFPTKAIRTVALLDLLRQHGKDLEGLDD